MAIRIPDELSKAVANGRAVLFVGAGMSRPQLPGWVGLLERMRDWAAKEGIAPPAHLATLIGRGKLMLAADELRRALGRRTGECLQALLDPQGLELGPAHALTWKLPFGAVVTTNFDRLLEHAANGVPVYTWRDEEGMTRAARGAERALVKVHGCVSMPDTVVLGGADYRKLLFSNEPYKRFMQHLLIGKTILFMGYGLQDYDLEPLMEEMQQVLPKGRAPDFALFDVREMSPPEIESYKERFGVELIYDPAATGFPDYAAFLQQLQDSLPEPDAVASRQVNDAEVADIRGLLQDSGQADVTETRAGNTVCFLGKMRLGVMDTSVVTHFVPGKARIEDLSVRPEGGSQVQVIAGSVPDDVREEANRRNVPIYTRDQFVGRLVDFTPHHDALREGYQQLEIEKYFVPLDAFREGSEARTPLDDYVDRWLAAPGRNMLSVLGDFGTGKTWFVQRLAQRLISNGGPRTPVLILLRDYSKAYDMKQALTDAMLNQAKVRLAAGIGTLERLNREGRLVLIFDGFDEMERRVSDHQTAEENFKRIEEWAAPGSKVLLTCRTEFFRSRKHEEEILERGPRERVWVRAEDVSLGKQPESIRLAPFSDAQLQAAFRLRMGSGWEQAYDRITEIPGLQELTDRPVLIEMITRSWVRLKDGGKVSLSGLYRTYAEDLLRLRPQDTITLEQRLEFVEALAYDMQKSGEERVAHTAFKERVKRQFQVEGDKQIDYWETQARTGSLLRRDGQGVYQFAHKSMREYFVARRLAERLLAGDAEEMALTDAIGRFVYELLEGQVRYERKEQDGMVWVPPGPFVYGSDSEKNMRVVNLPGFWIDKYPVTNEQYCRFLNSEGNRAEDGSNWYSPGAGMIRNRGPAKRAEWVIEPGFARHPVTGVAQYGAAAYAKWAGKSLPSEEQWEKAARGVDGRIYPWGEEFDKQRCNTRESGRGGTTEAGTFDPAGVSPWGCSDFAGNVWEWTSSRYKDGGCAT